MALAASEAHRLRLGPGHARHHPLTDHPSRELRHGAEYLHLEPASGRGGVQGLCQADKPHAKGAEFIEGENEVPQAPAQAVKFPDHEELKLPSAGVLQQGIERWSEAGGGAAGWSASVVTVVPIQVSASEVALTSEPSQAAFRMSHTGDLRLTWKGDGVLHIEFPDTSAILYAAPGGVYTPTTLGLKITYNSAEAAEYHRFEGGSKCLSGNREVPTPAPRRLR